MRRWELPGEAELLLGAGGHSPGLTWAGPMGSRDSRAELGTSPCQGHRALWGQYRCPLLTNLSFLSGTLCCGAAELGHLLRPRGLPRKGKYRCRCLLCTHRLSRFTHRPSRIAHRLSHITHPTSPIPHHPSRIAQRPSRIAHPASGPVRGQQQGGREAGPSSGSTFPSRLRIAPHR